MSRRPLLRAVLLLAPVLAVSPLSPDVRWQIWGSLRGEAFYKGRPTSYWRDRVLAWNDLGFYRPAMSLFDVYRPRRWFACTPWSRRSLEPVPADVEEPFPGNDLAAVPVLQELLRDEEAGVRAEAAEALFRTGPAARDAVPGLRRALTDADQDVRQRATDALRRIDPLAAAEAGVP